MADKKTLLASIETLQASINDFVALSDEFICRLSDKDYQIEGEALRGMQSRLQRVNSDLSQLYRRLDP